MKRKEEEERKGTEGGRKGGRKGKKEGGTESGIPPSFGAFQCPHCTSQSGLSWFLLLTCSSPYLFSIYR